jgi:4a-hydroxytetrahydrobiopterin dehydratase
MIQRTHLHYNPHMAQKLDDNRVSQELSKLKGWTRQGDEIMRLFSFKDFHETMSFVNAVAFIANQLDHHPDMEVGYNKLKIRFSTHSVGGLSESDFKAAARIDALGA